MTNITAYSFPETRTNGHVNRSRKQRRVIDNGERGKSKAFGLDGIYPNPFFAVATIAFMLAGPTHVRLELMTLADEPVHLFLDRNLKVGSHKVIIDREIIGLRSGDYAVRMSCSDGKMNVARCMLITVR